MHQVKYEKCEKEVVGMISGILCNSVCDGRAIGRSENLRVPVLFGGHNLPPPLVEIGLTDLPKSGTPGTPRDDTPGWCAVCVRPALSCMVVQSVLSALFFFPSAAQFVLNIICI